MVSNEQEKRVLVIYGYGTRKYLDNGAWKPLLPSLAKLATVVEFEGFEQDATAEERAAMTDQPKGYKSEIITTAENLEAEITKADKNSLAGILLLDIDLTFKSRLKKAWEAVIVYLRGRGGTVVLAGMSHMAGFDDIKKIAGEFGHDWKGCEVNGYKQDVEAELNRKCSVFNDHLQGQADKMPTKYKPDSVTMNLDELRDALYTTTSDSKPVAVVAAFKAQKGHFAFLGDKNNKEGTTEIILSLLNLR